MFDLVAASTYKARRRAFGIFAKKRILQQMVTMGFSTRLAIAVGALSLLVHPCDGFSMSMSSARLARLSSHSGIGISPVGGIRRIHAGQTAQIGMAMKEGKDGRIHENPESIMTRRSALLSAIGAGIALAAAPQDALAAPAKAKETVLVVGAKGAIGREVILALQAKGCDVVGLTRFKDDVPTDFPDGVKWVQADLKVPASLEPVMKGVDRVVYAPGAHFWEDPSNNRRIYDEAVGILANLGKDTTKRFLYVSSGGICTDDPPKGYLFDVFKYKRRGEDKLRSSGVPFTIVRAYQFQSTKSDAAKYYGISRVQSDDFVMNFKVGVDQDDALQNRRAIYLRDFADVIVGSLFASTAEGKTFDAYNTMDLVPEGGDNREWLKAVSKLPTDSELTKLGKPWPVDLQIPDDVRVGM